MEKATVFSSEKITRAAGEGAQVCARVYAAGVGARVRASEMCSHTKAPSLIAAFFCAMLLATFAWAGSASATQEGTSDASAADIQTSATQTADTSWYTQNPTAKSYDILTPAQLRGLSALVNGEVDTNSDGKGDAVSFEGVTITQKGDLYLADLTSTGTWQETPFSPIGSAEHPFAGTYDGGGYDIYGLCVRDVYTYAGLFGATSKTSVIKSVSIASGDGESAPKSTVEINASTQIVRHVGSLVGRAQGSVLDSKSGASVSVISTTPATKTSPYVVQNVGGLIGSCTSDVSNCTFTSAGSLTVKVSTDTAVTDSDKADDLRVADSFGGVVGRFGDVGAYGTLSGCTNEGTIWVIATGAGSQDRFKVNTYAAPFFVGGVCGYSNGNVINCTNGTFNELKNTSTGLVSTSATNSPTGDPLDNQGGDQVAGVVGGLRSVSEVEGKYNDGDPENPVVIRNCSNVGCVTGRVSVAGIVGETGAYTTVSQSKNGIPSQEMPGHITSTRWNKPISGGVIGRTWGGTIAWCANYAIVENTQTGYYMAGVCGALFASSDYPDLTPEMYGCLNTGNIYTSNRNTGTEYREAGILGTNEGYVHDCIMLKGTVPYHSDEAIGSMDWGSYSNLVVMTQAEMQSASSAALLNASAAQDQNWDCYWFVNGSGYPILNTWATDADRIDLSELSVTTVEQTAEAPYLGVSGAIPTFSLTLADGTTLVQNTDFYVVPQADAIDMSSGEKKYTASIVGLGRYIGELTNYAAYSIGKGDLAQANIVVSSEKYNFGKVVFPASVEARIAGRAIDTSEYNYIIYDSNTNEISENKPRHAVYDSLGYVSFDGGASKELVAGHDLNNETRSYILYDRSEQKISDSAGNVYYVKGSGGLPGVIVDNHKSCVALKKGSPAGNIVLVQANETSEKLTGSCIGHYVISQVSLYADCTLESATCQGVTWSWDADASEFYVADTSGTRTSPAATFTGETITPEVTLTCGSRTLVKDSDYRIVSGDPNPSQDDDITTSAAQAGSDTDTDPSANRNVTSDKVRAAITIRPVDTLSMSNYLIGYFDIAPAKLKDCEISLEKDTWGIAGAAVEPQVKVTLNGVELIEDTDYTVSYANNTSAGTASYTVTAKDNLSGGNTLSYTGTFTIVDQTQEIAGDTRIETAIAAAKSAYPQGAAGVIVASSSNFPDALAASSLAGALDYPILLASDDSIDTLKNAVRALGAKQIIVVGGVSAVSQSVESALVSQVGKSNMERLSGDTRYDTQMEIYDYGCEHNLWKAAPIIATGSNFPDALSISPYAAYACAPIFLVSPEEGLSARAMSALASDYKGATNTVIVGGTAVVSESVASQVKNATGTTPTRLSGIDRYETSKKISEYSVDAGMTCERVGIATGTNYPDALAAGPVQAKTGSLVLLVAPGETKFASAYLSENAKDVVSLVFFGGKAVLPQSLRAELSTVLGWN